jgi:hypothetical protein
LCATVTNGAPERPVALATIEREDAAVADAFVTTRHVLDALRREGVPFDDAWRVAFPAPQPNGANASVRLALAETRTAWWRAYDGEPPTAGEIAAARMFAIHVARLDNVEDRGGEIGGVMVG